MTGIVTAVTKIDSVGIVTAVVVEIAMIEVVDIEIVQVGIGMIVIVGVRRKRAIERSMSGSLKKKWRNGFILWIIIFPPPLLYPYHLLHSIPVSWITPPPLLPPTSFYFPHFSPFSSFHFHPASFTLLNLVFLRKSKNLKYPIFFTFFTNWYIYFFSILN